MAAPRSEGERKSGPEVQWKSGLSAVVALAFGKALALLSWTALIALAGSQLPSADYGRLLLAANLAGLAIVLGSFGQPQVLLYRSGRLGTGLRSLTHHAQLMSGSRVLAWMTAAAIAAVAWFLISKGTLGGWLLAAWCIWAAGSCWQALMAEEAKAVSHMWTAGLVGNSAAAGGGAVLATGLLLVLAIPALTPWQPDLLLYLAALAGASMLCSLWLLAQYLADRNRRLALPGGSPQAAMTAPSEAWRSGAVVTANTLLVFVIGLSDLWWANSWFGVEAAGSYGTAAYLARFCSLLSILLSGAYAGRFAAQLAQGHRHEVARKVRSLAWLATGAGALVWLCLAAAGGAGLLGRWFHLETPGSMTALLALGAGHVLGSLFGFGPVLLASAGRFKDLLVIAAASAALTAVLSAAAVWVGWGLGGLGAAFGSSYVVFVYICHRRCQRALGIDPFAVTANRQAP